MKGKRSSTLLKADWSACLLYNDVSKSKGKRVTDIQVLPSFLHKGKSIPNLKASKHN